MSCRGGLMRQRPALRARPKYHIFGHVHEEGLKRKAMLGGTTYINVSYFEERRH